ncbi:ABC transporter ATP-binding protein [Paenibacillus sp. M1]|uniref:ABC transporter ATP-binding protein n=1 Tax=Paenibacillus haidiansis TaxID=1574488 RepID=A0ABU7VXC5_9BACL
MESSIYTGEAAAAVQNLRLKFPGECDFIFKDFSFSVERGEKLLLLGPSGCGKSTLLQVLAGVIPGVVEVPMKCSGQIIPPSRGILFQDPDTQFCMPYVDEELAFVLENRNVPREEMLPRMREALRQVGLDFNEIHVLIDSLSQGMKQRLALASILLLDPDVLLLDEPSALLDPEGRRQIWQAVRQIAGQRTLIIVEHRIEELLELGLVDRVALIGPSGQLLGQGAPAELFSRCRKEIEAYGIWHPGVWEGRNRPEMTGRRTDAAPLIELSEFQGFRQGKEVIRAERAALFPGDFVAVTGPNGAGKSSLLLSLIGLLPSKGEYTLCGQRISGSGSRKRRVRFAADRIGFVFQNPEFQFVENEVIKEIAFSMIEAGVPADEACRRAEKALYEFGLAGLGQRHPYQLSLGQKRRLSVAGAAVMDKPVLLLDEPTFGQDAVNTFAILRFCQELRRKGIAIIMVTHEEKIAETAATRRWEVRNGVLTDYGTGEYHAEPLTGAVIPEGRQEDAERVTV